jgi:hypothetical protein
VSVSRPSIALGGSMRVEVIVSGLLWLRRGQSADVH